MKMLAICFVQNVNGNKRIFVKMLLYFLYERKEYYGNCYIKFYYFFYFE